jgi:Cu/Ag efflux protein CusF
MKQTLCLTLFAAVVLTLTSCSTPTYAPIDEKGQSATFQEGVPGGTVVETYQLTATVTAIDAPARKVTLVTKDGEKTTVKCGPDVINFDQIQVGDNVKARVTAQMTVAMADAANPPTDRGTGLVVLAPKGAKPGGLVAETQQYTATITALNLKRREATLRFPDDSIRTFTVRKDVDLTQRKVGEKVAFWVTATVALSVEKP